MLPRTTCSPLHIITKFQVLLLPFHTIYHCSSSIQPSSIVHTYGCVHSVSWSSHMIELSYSWYHFTYIAKLSNHYIFMSLPVTCKCQRCTIRIPSHMANVHIVSSLSQVTWLVFINFQSVPSHMAINHIASSVQRCVNMPSHMASVASIGGKGL